MARIDQQTVQKILDTAEIVDVVSDFVTLKKRGANYIGLCPFHNERTPSFSVSPSRNICKCFSCGKGGSPVNFLIELEHMSFAEALRYLANKYHIEIQEHEQTDAERAADEKRQSMLAINDFAMNYFEHVMADTEQGRQIGLAYFRERGINDAMIKRFNLGYSLEDREALPRAAKAKGFNTEYLVETGLCFKNDHGILIDRFRGRVIYPVLSVSGKVVAFGGRTLRKDRDVAKYVNSPESEIYSKSRELYGLYQAKQAISRKDLCILVEGYMDVISMHQAGVENVVASSGTSLTEGQIRLIHRFTENVLVIYDSDPAGVKASLRGIDLLLAEGMNIKVLSLPEGDDPDSFAQSHSSSEVEEYINVNATDFIAFKTRIMLADAGSDPIKRSNVIRSIVESISMIPNMITRSVYIGETSRTLGVDEKVLTLEVEKRIADRMEKERVDRDRDRLRREARLDEIPPVAGSAEAASTPAAEALAVAPAAPVDANTKFLRRYESDVARYAVRYARSYLCDAMNPDGSMAPMNVIDYIHQELSGDDLRFSNADIARVYDAARVAAEQGWDEAWTAFNASLAADRDRLRREGIERIRQSATDLASIESQERSLDEEIETYAATEAAKFAEMFVQKALLSSSDDMVRSLATRMVTDRHQLSKIHTKFSKVEEERDRLPELVPLAIYNLKEAVIECRIRRVMADIADTYRRDPSDTDAIANLMRQNAELNELKKQLSKYLGERVISPRR